jgi:hypothetical protein
MTVILSRSSRPLKAVEGGEGPDRLSPEISAPAGGKNVCASGLQKTVDSGVE